MTTLKVEVASDEGHQARVKRESFRHDTLNAWEAYRTTGLHLTAEEADAWLGRLEQGNDIEPPNCHV